MIALLFSLGLQGCVISGGENQWTFAAPDRVDVRLGNGSVSVTSSEDDRLHLEWDGGGIGDGPIAPVESGTEGKDTVTLDASDLIGGGDLEIRAPAGTALGLTVERGAIDVDLDAPASIDACVAAGSVDLAVPAGGYQLDLGIAVGELSTEEIWNDADSPFRLHACTAVGSLSLSASSPDEEPGDDSPSR